MVGLVIASATLRQRRRAAIVALIVVVATVVAVPYAKLKLPELAAFLPIFATVAAGGDALTAYLLFTQARVGRSWALFALALGYCYSAVIIVPHMLVFPGVFSPTGLLGATTQTAVYFWVYWHAGFPLFVIAYALSERRTTAVQPARLSYLLIAASIAAVCALAAMLLTFTIGQSAHLPALIQKGRYDLLITTGIGPAVLLAISAALVALVTVTKLRNVTHVWLAVALVATFCDCSLTLFAGGRYTLGWYVARVESIIASVVVLLVYLGAIATMFDRLARLSHIDGLTGLANRRSFDEAFEAQTTIAQRTDAPLSLLMLDVDWFKSFNDTYGHPRGDDVLRAVAGAIAQTLPRRTDLAARYGGEEFVVLLPATNAGGAQVVAERIRTAVEALALPHTGSLHGENHREHRRLDARARRPLRHIRRAARKRR